MVFDTPPEVTGPGHFRKHEDRDLSVTVQEARRLADGLTEAAYGVLDLREARADELTRSQSSLLYQSAQSLLMVSPRVRTEAVGLALSGIAEPGGRMLAAVEAASVRLDRALDPKIAVRIASGLVDMTVGLVARDPIQVARALEGLREDLS